MGASCDGRQDPTKGKEAWLIMSARNAAERRYNFDLQEKKYSFDCARNLESPVI